MDITLLVEALERAAVEKGNLDAKLKRYKYGSRNYRSVEQLYADAGMQITEIKSEIKRRVIEGKEWPLTTDDAD